MRGLEGPGLSGPAAACSIALVTVSPPSPPSLTSLTSILASSRDSRVVPTALQHRDDIVVMLEQLG